VAVCCFAKFVFAEPYMRICRSLLLLLFQKGVGGRDWYGILVYHRTAVALTSYTYVGYWFSS